VKGNTLLFSLLLLISGAAYSMDYDFDTPDGVSPDDMVLELVNSIKAGWRKVRGRWHRGPEAEREVIRAAIEEGVELDPEVVEEIKKVVPEVSEQEIIEAVTSTDNVGIVEEVAATDNIEITEPVMPTDNVEISEPVTAPDNVAVDDMPVVEEQAQEVQEAVQQLVKESRMSAAWNKVAGTCTRAKGRVAAAWRNKPTWKGVKKACTFDNIKNGVRNLPTTIKNHKVATAVIVGLPIATYIGYRLWKRYKANQEEVKN